jgi:hypothetical protein
MDAQTKYIMDMVNDLVLKGRKPIRRRRRRTPRVTTTSKLEKAQQWAKEAIGKNMRVRVDKNTCWAGTIKECTVAFHEDTPLGWHVTLEFPSGATKTFTVDKIPS